MKLQQAVRVIRIICRNPAAPFPPAWLPWVQTLVSKAGVVINREADKVRLPDGRLPDGWPDKFFGKD